MKSIIIIVTFILFVALVAQAWAVTKPKGKKSKAGLDRNHKALLLQPMDKKNFDWKKARDPFKRADRVGQPK